MGPSEVPCWTPENPLTVIYNYNSAPLSDTHQTAYEFSSMVHQWRYVCSIYYFQQYN